MMILIMKNSDNDGVTIFKIYDKYVDAFMLLIDDVGDWRI